MVTSGPCWCRRGSVPPTLFTSSTSFANPAVTIARSLTDTFSGIDPSDVPAFVVFQLVGAALGATLALILYGRGSAPSPSLDLPEPVHEDADAARRSDG